LAGDKHVRPLISLPVFILFFSPFGCCWAACLEDDDLLTSQQCQTVPVKKILILIFSGVGFNFHLLFLFYIKYFLTGHDIYMLDYKERSKKKFIILDV
jgi:hypothetical protein